MKTFLSVVSALLLCCAMGHAQGPGVPIESNAPLLKNGPLLEKAKALREAGKLPLTIAKVKEQLAKPEPVEFKLLPPSTKVLSGREVAQRARAAYLRVGWYYLCNRCDNWHLKLAGGYSLDHNVAATCHHCVEPGSDMREGYLIAVDPHGEVVPVRAIAAQSEALDAAILRLDGGKFEPLPLTDNVAPGDPAFCFSEPLDQHGYFSEGIVNRFYWARDPGDVAANTLNVWKHLRINVSTDWAQGSSGSAVLDQYGNAIGHVSRISPMSSRGQSAPGANEGDKPQPNAGRSGATVITLHEAVPARGVMMLMGGKNLPVPPVGRK